MVDGVGHAQCVEPLAHPGEVGGAGVAEVVEEVGGVRSGGPALGCLAVEHPQRVLQVAVLVGRAELVGPGGHELLQQGDVARLADAVAHGVELEGDLAQAEAGEEVVGERDHLDVEVGVGHPECLHAQLVVLTVATLLGPLVPEQRRHVPGLPGRDGVVLHEGAGDRGRALRAQGHQLPVAVREDVHLLADDLALLTDAAVEDALVLDDRREGEAIAGALDQGGEAHDRVLPADRLGPQDVVHAGGRAAGCGCGRGGDPRSRHAPHGLGLRLSCQAADDRRRRPRRGASTH